MKKIKITHALAALLPPHFFTVSLGVRAAFLIVVSTVILLGQTNVIPGNPVVVNGNVGIGTATPSTPLSVVSSGSASNTILGEFMQPSLPNGGISQIQLGQSAEPNASGTLIYTYNSSTPALSTLSLGLFNDSFALNVNGNGNVGIGTKTPGAPLSVVSSSSASNTILGEFMQPSLPNGGISQIQLGQSAEPNASGTLIYTHNSSTPALSYLSLGLFNDSFTLNVNGDSNVGIGTTAPQAKLDVEGGDLRVGGSVYANGQLLGAPLTIVPGAGITITQNGNNTVTISVSSGSCGISSIAPAAEPLRTGSPR